MSLKSKALIPIFAAVTVLMTSHGANASSTEYRELETNTNGSIVSVDTTHTSAQDLFASVDSSPVEAGEVRVVYPPEVRAAMSCVELRDAGALDIGESKCKDRTWMENEYGVPDDSHLLGFRPTPSDSGDEEEVGGFVPDARVLLEYAVAQVQALGAGVVKQPTWDTLMDVPTLVYVTAPTQTLTTTLFGAEVTVLLEATRFSYDFGDGSAPLVTTDPGAPYPAKRVYHVYQRRQSDVVITLTTTWRGSVTSPFDGSTASLNGVVTTVESTQPFRVCKAHIYTVPLPEERTREEQARLDEFERKSREECNVWNTTPTH